MKNYVVVRGLVGYLLMLNMMSCRITNDVSVKYIYNYSGDVNYENLKNWAAHPLKKDNSDSFSNVYKEEINLDLCDIFFLHPTSLTDKNRKNVMNADIEDEEINLKTDGSSILYQASIFNRIGRIYAPRYRQAHIQRYFDTGNIQKEAFLLAYKDVRNAFLEYLEKWNEGRPLIIAAHSQGTTHAIRLINEMIDGHAISSRVIYVYLLGMPVAKDEFVNLKPCLNDTSINCYFSWRTYRRGYSDQYTSKQNRNVHVTNPVDINVQQGWTGRNKKGTAILWNYNVGYEKTHDTKVMGDMLWITRPKFRGGILGLFMKNYHAGDFNLYYGDIRENIERRIKEYQTK